MSNPNKLPRGPLLIGILLIAALWQSGLWGVTETSEARYAEISREMLVSGDLILPRYLGILHFDKPPMTYWITALGYKIWGINPFGARFFLQIVFAVQLALVYRIAQILFGSRTIAIYSLICYAAIPLSLISIRNLTTDAYLNTFALASVYLYILYRKNNSIAALYGFFIALGIAIFTKGPFALLLPLLAIYPVNRMISIQAPGRTPLIHFILGIAVTLTLGGWWFFYLMSSSSGFYNFFIGGQIVNRLAHADKLSRSKPFWYYIALLPPLILPLLGLMMNWLAQLKNTGRNINRLGMYTILIPVVLFSCSSSKLILYILPVAPYIACCAGYLLNRIKDNRLKNIFVVNSIFYGMLILAMVILSSGGINEFPVVLNIQILTGITALAAYFIYTLTTKAGLKRKYLLQLLIIPVFILPLSTNILSQIELTINSTEPLAAFIQRNLPKRKVLVWNRALNSISFNLQEQVYSIRYNHYSLIRNTQFEPDHHWKQQLIDVNNTEEQLYLRKLISDRSILIRYKSDEIPAGMEWISQAFSARKDFGKYIIYYH